MKVFGVSMPIPLVARREANQHRPNAGNNSTSHRSDSSSRNRRSNSRSNPNSDANLQSKIINNKEMEDDGEGDREGKTGGDEDNVNNRDRSNERANAKHTKNGFSKHEQPLPFESCNNANSNNIKSLSIRQPMRDDVSVGGKNSNSQSGIRNIHRLRGKSVSREKKDDEHPNDLKPVYLQSSENIDQNRQINGFPEHIQTSPYNIKVNKVVEHRQIIPKVARAGKTCEEDSGLWSLSDGAGTDVNSLCDPSECDDPMLSSPECRFVTKPEIKNAREMRSAKVTKNIKIHTNKHSSAASRFTNFVDTKLSTISAGKGAGFLQSVKSSKKTTSFLTNSLETPKISSKNMFKDRLKRGPSLTNLLNDKDKLKLLSESESEDNKIDSQSGSQKSTGRRSRKVFTETQSKPLSKDELKPFPDHIYNSNNECDDAKYGQSIEGNYSTLTKQSRRLRSRERDRELFKNAIVPEHLVDSVSEYNTDNEDRKSSPRSKPNSQANVKVPANSSNTTTASSSGNQYKYSTLENEKYSQNTKLPATIFKTDNIPFNCKTTSLHTVIGLNSSCLTDSAKVRSAKNNVKRSPVKSVSLQGNPPKPRRIYSAHAEDNFAPLFNNTSNFRNTRSTNNTGVRTPTPVNIKLSPNKDGKMLSLTTSTIAISNGKIGKMNLNSSKSAIKGSVTVEAVGSSTNFGTVPQYSTVLPKSMRGKSLSPNSKKVSPPKSVSCSLPKNNEVIYSSRSKLSPKKPELERVTRNLNKAFLEIAEDCRKSLSRERLHNVGNASLPNSFPDRSACEISVSSDFFKGVRPDISAFSQLTVVPETSVDHDLSTSINNSLEISSHHNNSISSRQRINTNTRIISSALPTTESVLKRPPPPVHLEETNFLHTGNRSLHLFPTSNIWPTETLKKDKHASIITKPKRDSSSVATTKSVASDSCIPPSLAITSSSHLPLQSFQQISSEPMYNLHLKYVAPEAVAHAISLSVPETPFSCAQPHEPSRTQTSNTTTTTTTTTPTTPELKVSVVGEEKVDRGSAANTYDDRQLVEVPQFTQSASLGNNSSTNCSSEYRRTSSPLPSTDQYFPSANLNKLSKPRFQINYSEQLLPDTNQGIHAASNMSFSNIFSMPQITSEDLSNMMFSPSSRDIPSPPNFSVHPTIPELPEMTPSVTNSSSSIPESDRLSSYDVTYQPSTSFCDVINMPWTHESSSNYDDASNFDIGVESSNNKTLDMIEKPYLSLPIVNSAGDCLSFDNSSLSMMIDPITGTDSLPLCDSLKKHKKKVHVDLMEVRKSLTNSSICSDALLAPHGKEETTQQFSNESQQFSNETQQFSKENGEQLCVTNDRQSVNSGALKSYKTVKQLKEVFSDRSGRVFNYSNITNDFIEGKTKSEQIIDSKRENKREIRVISNLNEEESIKGYVKSESACQSSVNNSSNTFTPIYEQMRGNHTQASSEFSSIKQFQISKKLLTRIPDNSSQITTLPVTATSIKNQSSGHKKITDCKTDGNRNITDYRNESYNEITDSRTNDHMDRINIITDTRIQTTNIRNDSQKKITDCTNNRNDVHNKITDNGHIRNDVHNEITAGKADVHNKITDSGHNIPEVHARKRPTINLPSHIVGALASCEYETPLASRIEACILPKRWHSRFRGTDTNFEDDDLGPTSGRSFEGFYTDAANDSSTIDDGINKSVTYNVKKCTSSSFNYGDANGPESTSSTSFTSSNNQIITSTDTTNNTTTTTTTTTTNITPAITPIPPGTGSGKTTELNYDNHHHPLHNHCPSSSRCKLVGGGASGGRVCDGNYTCDGCCAARCVNDKDCIGYSSGNILYNGVSAGASAGVGFLHPQTTAGLEHSNSTTGMS